MKRTTALRAFNIGISLVILFSSFNIKAQIIKRQHVKKEEIPQFVLVQLPTEIRKIKWFSKGNNTKLVTAIKNDAAKVRAAMVKDFSDNFTAFPVYFYIDTNAQLVKEKKFNGILMDKNMQVVSNASNITQTYQVIIYGSGQPTNDDYNSSGAASNDAAYFIGSSKQHPVVYDDSYRKVALPAPNGDNMSTARAKKLGRQHPGYMYLDSKQDITYLPYASQLNAVMKTFYTPKESK